MCYSALVEDDIERLLRNYDATLNMQQFEILRQALEHADGKFKVASTDHRIFPGYFTPIISSKEGVRIVSPMRYSAFPPSYLSKENAKGLSTFNARRDSLGKRFWSESFRRYHGVIILKAFYEWVAVKDLVQAGIVNLEQVREEFQRQAEERRQRLLAEGKKYQPTKTELKDPMQRNIIISFYPESKQNLIVPAICSKDSSSCFWGFAIVTDEPTPEIRRAGHDRMPVTLDKDKMDAWLKPHNMNDEQLDAILGQKTTPRFLHAIARAA